MMKKIDKIRKTIAEIIIKIGFMTLPKFEDDYYLDDLIYGLNCNHQKITVNTNKSKIKPSSFLIWL